MNSSENHPFRLADRTSPEVVQLLATARTVIVPLGACEQHGAGMALRTDTTRAERVADRVAERLDGSVVITPAVPIGISEHHMGFAGTLTLRPTTLMDILRDLIDSLDRHGVRRVFVLTGHGGNNSAIDVAVGALRRSHPHLLLAWSGLSPLAVDVIGRAAVSEVHGHSGEGETSQALHLDPSLVQQKKLTRGAVSLADLNPAAHLSRTSPGIHFPQRYDELSEVGALGDPTAATAELGAELVDRIVERLCTFLADFNNLETSYEKEESDVQQLN